MFGKAEIDQPGAKRWEAGGFSAPESNRVPSASLINDGRGTAREGGSSRPSMAVEKVAGEAPEKGSQHSRTRGEEITQGSNCGKGT